MAKLRNGVELNEIQFYKPQDPGLFSSRTPKNAQLSSARAEKAENGLPIFDNKQYIQDLKNLLSSKDLDECYDYEANDQSYKKLYECLSYRKGQSIIKQKVVEKSPTSKANFDQSVTKLDGV